MSFLSLLNKSVTIQRDTVTRDAMKAEVHSWGDVATGVKAAIQPRGGSYPVGPMGADIESSHVGFFPTGTDVQVGDHVIDGSTTYRVVYVGDDAGRTHHIIAGLEI